MGQGHGTWHRYNAHSTPSQTSTRATTGGRHETKTDKNRCALEDNNDNKDGGWQILQVDGYGRGGGYVAEV